MLSSSSPKMQEELVKPVFKFRFGNFNLESGGKRECSSEPRGCTSLWSWR